MTPIAAFQLVAQIAQLAIIYVPALKRDLDMALDLLAAGTDPTPEQAAQIDAALEAAHAALQAARAATI